jgi:predicted HNH restriction endonuclease
MKREKRTRRALWVAVFGPKPMTRKARARDQYNRRVRVWLSGKKCEACGRIAPGVHPRGASQCHHKHGRGWRGELLMVEDLWLPVCAGCHRWIHDHPAQARKLGLLAKAGEWNRRPS